MVLFHRATIEFASRTGNGPPVVVANYPDVKPPLPEEKLFHSVFRAVLIYKVISGLGKLSLIWATVVILGGFITLIKSLDFWIVTAIVFIEAIRIFSTAEDPEEQIFIRAPEVMKGIQRTKSKCSYPFFFASVFPVALTLAQLAAVSTSIALSLWRLIKQEYVDHGKKCDKDSCKDEQENIRMSLNIFYVLVVVQAIMFFSNLTSPMVKQMYMVCDKYNLEHGQGLELLARYILDNHIKCVTGNVRSALNNDLVTYAKELLFSDATEDQHLGVWTIDRILRNHANNRYFLMKLRAFGHDAIGRIVSLLGSSHGTETPDLASREDMKAHAAAARVLLELAPSLLLESFPGMLQLVSLLLTERRIVHIDSPGDNDSRRQGYDVNFTWYGVQILEKLVDNPDNCWHVVHTANCLVPNIIDLITNYANKEIVQTSVTVLRKLSGSAGDVGDALRCSISKNIHILSSITSILEDRTGGQPSALQAEAADILSCLALDQACKQDMCTSRRVIRALATILVVNAAEVADIPEEDSRSDRARVAKCAAEALVLLTTRSNSQSCNAASILLEIVPECIQQFVGIISHEEAEHKYLITKLLSNLRAYSNADQYAYHLKKIDNALPEILKAINLGLEKLLVPEHPSGDYIVTSKLLDSFAGLAVQICTRTRAAHQHFAIALNSADLEAGAFVHKLKEMLVLHKSPTTEFPGIRRTTVQLIIWMMRNTSNGYTRHFMQCGMDEALREVADTETMLERFELFHYGVGVCKHTEPISSLINIARTGM